MAQEIPFIGGVSQKPEELRAAFRVGAQDNMWSHPALGLIRRPPTSVVGSAALQAAAPSNPQFHFIERSANEKYAIMFDGATVKAWDALTGAAVSVLTPDGTGYLPTNSKDDLRLLTVGDSTFIVNRTKVVKQGTKKAPQQAHEALIFVRQVDWDTVFTVTLNGTAASTQTIAQAAASAGQELSTDNVAADLISKLAAVDQINADFTFHQYGSTIHVARWDGTDFSITSSDGLSDKGLKVIKGTAQAIEDLPARAKDGMIVHLVGDPGSSKDDLWVQYEDGGSPEQDGVWRETAAPGSPLDLDASTMPWKLTLNGAAKSGLKAGALPKAPRVTVHSEEVQTAGFTADADNSATTYDGDSNIPIRYHGTGVVGTVPGLDGTTRLTKIPFDVDTSLLETGEQAEVRLLANTGTGGAWEQHASRTYSHGRMHANEQFEVSHSWAAGTQVALRVFLATKADPANASRQVNLMAHRQYHPTHPGISTHRVYERIVTFDAADLYPPGTTFTVTANSKTFTYTVSGTAAATGAQVASSLQALIDADATLTATMSGSSAFIIGAGTSSVSASVKVSPAATTLWLPDQNMVAGAHNGRTVTNLSDGSTGVVSTSGTNFLVVSSLSGGVDNAFQPGDSCRVEAGAGVFALTKIDWAERSVGDLDSNPFPSFLNQTITEPVFYQNRLGFLSEMNAVLSAAGDYFRFTRRTVSDLLPDDPIDVTVATPSASTLERGVEWAGHLCLIMKTGVAALSGNPALEPSTVQVEQKLFAHIDTTTPPALVGERLLVAQPAGAHSKILEIFLDPYSGRWTSDDVTKEIPTYIGGPLRGLTGSLGHGILVAAPGGTSLYVFSFAFQQQGGSFSGPSRSFEAWQRWTFANAVYAACVMGEQLYLITTRTTGLTLEAIPIADIPTSGSFNDAPELGGYPVAVSLTLSRPYPRDNQGNAVKQGRLQVRYLKLHYGSGSGLTATVTPKVGAARSRSITNAAADGVLSVPILTRNTEMNVALSAPSDGPMNLTALEWETLFASRSRPE